MPRLAWPESDLNELDADSWLSRTTREIESVMSRYAPKPASSFTSEPEPAPATAPVPPSFSLRLEDWTPWNETPAASAAPVQPAASPLSALDDAGWFPWRTPKPAPALPAAIPSPEQSAGGTPVVSPGEARG